MSGYTKLFSEMLDSSVWQEPAETRLVWVTMLAMADQHGEVMASIPGLARRAGVTVRDTEEALQVLASPDPYSRTPDAEGRRIESIDGGWALINHEKYREKGRDEEKREKARERQRRKRARDRRDSGVTGCEKSRQNTQAEAEAEAEATKPKNAAKSPPTYPGWFEKFWKAYPPNESGRKRGKQKTLQVAEREVPAADRDLLTDAAVAYRKEQTEFIRDPERFVKAGFWRDYLGEAERPTRLPPPRTSAPEITGGMAKRALAKEFGLKPKLVNDWDDERAVDEYRQRLSKQLPVA